MRESPRLLTFDLPCWTRKERSSAATPGGRGRGPSPSGKSRLNPVGLEVRVIRLLRVYLPGALLVREFVTGFDVQRGVNQVDTISIDSPA